MTATYSGSTIVTPTSYTFYGLVNGETVTSVSSATVNNKNVAINGSNYVLSVSGVMSKGSLANYTLTGAYKAPVTPAENPANNTANEAIINKAPLGVTLKAFSNGTTTYPIADATITGNPDVIITNATIAYASATQNAINYVTALLDTFNGVVAAALGTTVGGQVVTISNTTGGNYYLSGSATTTAIPASGVTPYLPVNTVTLVEQPTCADCGPNPPQPPPPVPPLPPTPPGPGPTPDPVPILPNPDQFLIVTVLSPTTFAVPVNTSTAAVTSITVAGGTTGLGVAPGKKVTKVDVQSPEEIIGGLVPEYPRNAELLGIKGQVTVSVEVSAEGKVFNSAITSTAGDLELDYAVKVAAETWEFAPNAKNEVRKVQVLVNFSPGD